MKLDVFFLSSSSLFLMKHALVVSSFSGTDKSALEGETFPPLNC